MNRDLFVICQICTAQIAKLPFILSSDGKTHKLKAIGVSYPLTGKMFLSPDPFHEIPPPFLPELDWDNFHCPFGGHRPMTHRDKILTSEGVLNVPMDGSEPYFTPNTGELGREAIYDRDQEPPPAMSEAEAEAFVRRNMALAAAKETKSEGDQEHGKTDTQPREQESNPTESIETKEETQEAPGDDNERTTDEEPVGVLSHTCPLCDHAPFKTYAGKVNHLRIVHNIKGALED